MTGKQERIKVALVGNPNSGKSSLFNLLTGLRQSVSNFPGVTVDKKVGTAILNDASKISIIDLPGLYSMHPNSSDEKLVVNVLTDLEGDNYPDLVIYVADATNLERHLLLATQIIDLKIPMIFALNMIDILEENNKALEIEPLSHYLQVPVVAFSGRNEVNIEGLKSKIQEFISNGKENFVTKETLYKLPDSLKGLLGEIEKISGIENPYYSKIIGHHYQ